jgi:hypothetical protein
MKKAVSIIIAGALLIACLGCGRNETDIYAVMDKLCIYYSENSGQTSKYTLISGETAPAGYAEWSAEKFGRLYTGLYEKPACFALITAYAIRLPSDESGFEIHAVRCQNRSDTDEVSALLQKRIKKISSSEIKEYAPESFEMYYSGSEIFVYRDTVYLLATPDNAAAKKLIRKYS